MTEHQRDECATIIRDASNAALVAGAVSEAAVKAVHVTMVMNLAAVFDVSITKAVASGIINRELSGSGLFADAVAEGIRWIFPLSRAPLALRAAAKTEDFGWKVARDFDNE